MSTQRFQSLAHWGAFTAVVENGRFVRAEPFAHDPHPSPMLATLPELVYSPARVRQPTVREGWLRHRDRRRTGHDRWVEVSWDTALSLVADELSRVRAEHGSEAIFGGSYGWSSAGRFHHARTQVRRFLFSGGGCVDQSGNYSWGAAQFFLPYIIGTFAPVSGKVTDWNSIVRHGELVLAFGGLPLKNVQVGSGGVAAHDMQPWLERACAAGVEFVSISPSRGDTPDFVGAQWIAPRPNTDVVLLLALAHEIAVNDWHDRDFLDRCCEGYPRFERYLLGLDDGTPKSPEWAAAICGVEAATIRALAARLPGRRVLVTMTWSLQRAHHGEQPFWMAIALAAMLGQIGLPGGGFAFGHGSIHGVGNPRPAGAVGPEMPMGRNPTGRSIPVARAVEMLESPGADYTFCGKTHRYPDIRMIYWAGGNPFHHHQDLNRMRRAWQRPETIVVHESQWTPTARHADIVLPATTFLERDDVGAGARDTYVIAMHRALPPQHAARDDFDVFRELAERGGYAHAYTEGRSTDAWVRWIYDTMRDRNAQAGIELPPYEAFREQGWTRFPAPDRDFVLFDTFREDPNAHPLSTRSGRIELWSETLASYRLPDCLPHPAWLPPAEWLGAEAAARYPIHLVTVQPVDKLHSQGDFGPVCRARKVSGHEPVTIHPSEATRRGLVGGDVVRIHNARGACLAGVIVDAGVREGVAIMSTGAWYTPQDASDVPLELLGNPNVLAFDRGTSGLAQGASGLSILVEIEKYAGTATAEKAWQPPEMVAA